MTLELVDGDAGEPCDCVHFRASHPDDGPCQRTLPAIPETETPEWRCPCRKYRAKPPGPWRWHAPTGSWAGVPAAS